MFNKQIKELMNIIKERNLYGYIVFSSDYHGSEYIVDYFKAREFLTNFTGSAGTLLVTRTDAYLWVDGRYFIQAERQLANSSIKIMKMGTVNTPTLIEFLKQNMKENDVIAFDGRIASFQFVLTLNKEIPYIQIRDEEDLVSLVWKDRPALVNNKVYELPYELTGMTIKEKLEAVRKEMNNIDYHLIASLDEIAYLFNLRGKDIPYNPVFFAYALISQTDAILFIDKHKLTKKVKESLENQGVKIFGYQKVYSILKMIHGSILLNPDKTNFALCGCLGKKVHVYKYENPITLMKAIKNKVEIENSKRVHVEDGIAFTKFMYQIKNRISKENFTELSASDLLLSYRKKQKDYMEPSFETICAYKEHGAMMHYSATNESNKTITNEGLLLIDSGGQYYGGTTDITRTLVFKNITKEEKYHFTLALKSHIDLASAIFLRGCSGTSLDILARKPLWDVNLDYKCGTGHGIGYMLNVHEGPNSFRYNSNSAILKEGMITTNEPGIYLENKYGIRHENEMLTVYSHTNEMGEFLKFEPITYVPFDLDGIEVDMLTDKEKEWLNNYHQMVYETLKDKLTKKEAEWLKKVTRRI